MLVVFGWFEVEYLNVLWIGDVLYGIWIDFCKIYLFVFLDDYFWLVFGYWWGYVEDMVWLVVVLCLVLVFCGVFNVVYVDNGLFYVDVWLLWVCVKFGVCFVYFMLGWL